MKIIKKYEINIGYFIFGLIALGWTTWTSIHDITNIPRHPTFIDPSGPGSDFINTGNIGQYTKKFTTFFYFTTLSNVIFSIVTFVRAFHRKELFSYVSQRSVATYMVVTGVVFWSAIAYSLNWKNILVDFELIFLHLINPIFAVLLIFFFNNKNEVNISYNTTTVLKMILYPLIYYIAAWIFYIAISGNASIYPFLDFYHPFSMNLNIFLIIFINLAFFLAFFLALCSIFYALNYFSIKKLKISKQR